MPNVDLIRGMDFGVGCDLGGQLFGDAVLRTPGQQIEDTGGQTVDIFLTLVESQQDQDSALQLSTSISASYGLFGGSAKFDLSQEMHVHSYSVSVIMRATVMNSFKQMRDVQFGPNAIDLLKNGHSDRFKEQFGDFFVRGIQTGGELCAVLQIVGRDERDRTDIKASLQASGILGAVSADTKNSFSSAVAKATSNRETKLRHFQVGGVPKASIDPMEMVDRALNFAAEVKAGQSGAFGALVVPYQTVPTPFGPNFVDIANARETLAVLMQRRRDLLTRLTGFSFVQGHPEQFVIPAEMDVNAIVGKLGSAISVLTAAASRCVNKPAEAGEALAGVASLDVPLSPLPPQRAAAPTTVGTGQAKATLAIQMTMPGVLVAGGWRSDADLSSMSPDDQRNTVITELAGRTLDLGPVLQGFTDRELIGKAANYIFLLKAGIRSEMDMRAMKTDDVRNTIIVENHNHTGLPVPTLQGLEDIALAEMALGWFAKL